MSQPRLLSAAIGHSLKKMAFKQHADTWRRDTPDLIQVLNLQKSSYGAQYYVNVAIWLKALGSEAKPKEHTCHIRTRWNCFLPRTTKHLDRLLDLENDSFTEETRAAEIGELIDEYILPFFRNTESLDAIKELYNSLRWPPCLTTVSAQRLLAS